MVNKEFIRDYWIPALRSGEYQQTSGWLNITKPDTYYGEGYCCLGVACDLIAKHGLIEGVHWEDVEAAGYSPHRRQFSDGSETRMDTLPPKVSAFIGIDPEGTLSDFPVESYGDEFSVYAASLINLNDDFGYTFEQIANVLQQAINDDPDVRFVMPDEAKERKESS